MFVYVSKIFTAAATGSQLKEVTCEKCGMHFFYELSRTGIGSSSAPYMVGQGSAKKSSEKKAAADLKKRLKQGEETVPCPSCQWINRSAINAYRKTRQKKWTALAIAIGILGAVVSLVVWGEAPDILRRDASITDRVHWIIAGIWMSLVVLCLLAQWLLRRKIDPNRIYQGKKRLPAGTPPAIVPTGPDGNGEMQYEVIPYDLSLIDNFSKWAIFRANQFSLAPACCRCLGTPSTFLRLPFVLQAQPMPVPMCDGCRKTIIRNWWLFNLMSTLAGFAIAWALSHLPRQMEHEQRIILTVGGGLVLSGLGFCVIDEFIRPYKHAVVDGVRGISKIKFRNPAYTAL